MVISEILLSKAMPFFIGWCTSYLNFLFEGTFEVDLCFVSSLSYSVEANVIQKAGMFMTASQQDFCMA